MGDIVADSLTDGRGAAWGLVKHLRKKIEVGEFPPGSRLPSHRRLMSEHGLTSGTVSYAMSKLAEQGLIERRHGSGVFVRSLDATPAQDDLVALIVPEVESGLYLSLQAGMEDAARGRHKQLITVTTGFDAGRQADALFQLIERQVAGVAIVPSYEATPAYQMRQLQKAGVPLVFLHRGVEGVSAPVIGIPFLEVGRRAGEAIARAGHIRTAIVSTVRASIVSELYIAGFQRALAEHGAPPAAEIALSATAGLYTPQDFAKHEAEMSEVIRKTLSSSNRPTAVFTTFDPIAELLYLNAVRMGLRCPDDLSIVSFGSNRRIGAVLRRIAVVGADEYSTGRTAHDLLIEMRTGKRPLDSGEVFMMSVELLPAESLGPAAGDLVRNFAD